MSLRITARRTDLLTPLFAAFLVCAIALGANAQSVSLDDQPAPITLTKDQRAAVIDSIFTAIREIYVFPEVAAEMEEHVRKRFKEGAYDDLEAVAAFCLALTKDLQAISQDRHLHVNLMPPNEVEDFNSARLSEADRERIQQEQLARAAADNFGFKKMEILPGNVGYLKLDGFSDASIGGATAIAAMNFLSNTDAIIFDLRENGGGSPSMIQLITSYLLENSTHLNSFYIRKEDTTKQFWTAAHVEGPKMTGTDVYVVTSGYTFSAAEEFTYNLKNLERATIVGETTGGGAHPVESHVFPGYNVKMNVPYGRAINPITGTNWEGTGVTPHIESPAPMALDRAYLEALRNLEAKATDEFEAYRLAWAISGLEAELQPVQVGSEQLARYVGQYEDRRIEMAEGHLMYQRGENPPMKMIPMAENLFMFDEIDYFRREVVTDPAGDPTKVIGHYSGGRTDESMRTGGAMAN